MTTSSLNNNHDKIYAEAVESLIKADALIDFALHNDISETPPHTLHDFCWVISDLIKQAKSAVETLEGVINRQTLAQ